jgi:hypothetical protein
MTTAEQRAAEYSLAWYRAQNWFCKLLARMLKLREVYENGFTEGWSGCESNCVYATKEQIEELTEITKEIIQETKHDLNMLSIN